MSEVTITLTVKSDRVMTPDQEKSLYDMLTDLARKITGGEVSGTFAGPQALASNRS